MYKPHYLLIYQKPKQGTAFIRRIPTLNYRHSINAVGGFDTMSCDIALRSVDEMQQFLDQYLGNMVRAFVDNPVEPIWEGFINRMSFSAGGTQYTISLDDMANRITVKFTDPATSTTSPVTTATSNDTASQAVYGIKQDTIDMGVQNSLATSPTDLRTTILAQRAWPKTSRLPNEGGGGGLLHIECLGFFHTLDWENYQNTGTGNSAIGTYIGTLLAAVANTTTFFNNADTSNVAANATTTRIESVRGETIWARMRYVTESGDGTNYMVIGVSPTDFTSGLRTLYYRAFDATISYTAKQADGLIIRNLFGQKVDPWRVQPDNGVRISDMLIGWNGVGDNPTETWIASVDYDANRQLATWRGDDDVTIEGAFQFRRYNQEYGKRFGQARRVI